MLPPADMTGTRPLVHIEALAPAAPAGDARQETFNRLTQIAIGTQVRAEVLSRFDDGTFLVRIDGTAARMDLPGGTQVGQMLDLTLVAAEPRPTFLLGRQPDAATASLSVTGRLIDNLLQEAQQQSAPTSLVGKAPLVASSAAGTSQVAAALQNTLAFSGLFYESHVGQWAGGGRTLGDLMQEPQAQTGKLLPTDDMPQKNAAHADLARLTGNAHEAVDGGRTLLDMAPDSRTQSGKTGATDADRMVQPAAISSEAARMINLQLDALERRHVSWQGELWPGQPMEWEVKEDPQKNDAEAAGKAWQSVVRFDLPSLGAVTATVRLSDGHVQVQVRTATEAAATSLRAHGAMLANALDAAGSPLDLLTVKQDEPA
ncbi:MAG: hypothetical protein JWQ21_1087 [Herminiimonas sp.]|nr:hypothetical protein [Herminiimonas sp.]